MLNCHYCVFVSVRRIQIFFKGTGSTHFRFNKLLEEMFSHGVLVKQHGIYVSIVDQVAVCTKRNEWRAR